MPVFEIEAPNGKRLQVQGDNPPTEGQFFEIFQKAYPDDEAFQETVLERIGSAVGSVAQSAVGMGVKALEYFGKVAGNVPDTSLGRQTPIAVDQLRRSQPTVDPVLEGAKAAEASVAEAVPTLPQARESFLTGDVPSAVGSLVGGVATGLVGGAGGAMAVMFGAEAQDAYDRELARQQKAGEQKNEDKALFKSALYGTGATAIEYGLGAGYILRKIGEKFGVKAVKEVADVVGEKGWDRVAVALREGGKGGLAGFVEETAQSALQQKIVEGTVNWREAFREGAAGAVGQGGVATAVELIPQSTRAGDATSRAFAEALKTGGKSESNKSKSSNSDVGNTVDVDVEVVGEPGKIEGVPEAVQAANQPTETPAKQAQPAAQGANEEVEKGQQEEVLSAGTASMPPVPERVDQITEQLRLTGDPASTKAATLITPGSPIPAPAEGMVSLNTKHGMVVYNPAKISAQEITKAAEGDVFDGRVLGMASAATPIAGTTVVSTSTPAAPDVIAEVVPDTPSAIAEATIAQQKAVPGGQTEIKSAVEVANARKAPRIEPPIESRDQTAPSRSVAWDYEVITTDHPSRSKWADEQVAKFKPEELGQAARSAVEEARLTPDKRLVLLAKIAKKATQNADIETSQYVGKALEALSQQQGQGMESLKQVIEELTPYAPLLAYMKAVKPKGDLANVPATGPIREAWNELKRALAARVEVESQPNPNMVLFPKLSEDIYRALFRLAKVAAQEGVKSAKEFAELFGLKLTDAVRHAWQKAQTSTDPEESIPANVLKDAGRLVIAEPKKKRAKAQEFSQEVYDKMKGLAEKAAKLPDNSTEQNLVLQDMVRQLEDSLGLGLKDALLDSSLWFASVLMRVGTLENVGIGSTTQAMAWMLLGAADMATLGRSPKLALRTLSAFWQGMMDGGAIAKEIVRTGNYALLPDYKKRVQKFLAGKKGAKGDAFEAMLRRKNPLGYYAYTRRLMTAIDYIASNGVYDAGLIYASFSAKDQASLEAAQARFDKQVSKDAQDQARAELGPGASWIRVRNRTKEILDLKIDSQIRENAIQLARRNAQNADPQGITGEVYRAINHLHPVLKAFGGVSFLRSAFNFIRNASEFVPGVGAVTYLRSSKVFKDKIGDSRGAKIMALDMPPDQRRLLITSQIFGAGALIAGAAWALDDDDKEDFEISGGWRNVTPQQASALRKVGQQPYSIKINGHWIPYRQTPLAAVLAIIGGIRDNRRFDKEKWDEKSVMDKVLVSAFSGLAFFKDIASLSQLASMFNGQAGSTQEETADSTNKLLSNTVGRYLSGYSPSVIKEIERAYNPEIKAPLRDDLLGQWLKHFPVTFQSFVGQDNLPALDFFGEPIKATQIPFVAGVSAEKVEPEYKLVARWMGDGIFIPSAGRTAKVVDKYTAELRRMTDLEFYHYQREYGQFLKRKIVESINKYGDVALENDSDREKLSEALAKLGARASQYARQKLKASGDIKFKSEPSEDEE